MRSARQALLFLAGLLPPSACNLISPDLQKCMDIHAAKKEDGTRETLEDMRASVNTINVQLYRCHNKHNQGFIIDDGMIKSASLGRCLAATAEEANANVELMDCEKAKLKKWALTGEGSILLLGNTKTELCVDVKAALTEDGDRETFAEIKEHTVVNVHLYTCHKHDSMRVNQKWEWDAYAGDVLLRI